MAVPSIKTKRLVLRQIVPSDAPALHDVLSDVELMTWWSSAAHTTLVETEVYVGRNASDTDGLHCWAITEAGLRALGWVVLIEKRTGVAEIGYILSRDYWGTGYAREAVSAVVDHGFDMLRYRRIFADVDPENASSIRLLESIGFDREGRLRAEWETHIGVRDSLIFGLLKTDHRAT